MRADLGDVRSGIGDAKRYLTASSPWTIGVLTSSYWKKSREKRGITKIRLGRLSEKEKGLEKVIAHDKKRITRLNQEILNLAETYLWHIDVYAGSQVDYAKAKIKRLEDVPLNSCLQRILMTLTWDEDGVQRDVSIEGAKPLYLLQQKTEAIVDIQLVDWDIIDTRRKYEKKEIYMGRPMKEVIVRRS